MKGAAQKAAVQKALRRVTGPRLRALGFVGSFPTYRRWREKQIDIICFQFAWGTAFRLDCGVLPPRRSLGAKTAQKDVVVLTSRPKKRDILFKVTRFRPGGDFFFFDRIAPSSFTRLAKVVADVIEERGPRFFGDKRRGRR